MTTALHASPAPARTRAGRLGWILAAGAVLAAAFFLRLHALSHGAGLSASDGYDDGVYYAAADSLVHGRLPYRDVLLLHPPGIALALAPFAALGAAAGDHVGVGIARLAFIALATASVGLVMVLARPYSRRAAIVAGGIAATWFPLVYGERSTLLEPLGGFLVLASLTVSRRAGRRAAVLAGLLAGAAAGVKIWYVAPLVVLATLLPRRRGAFAGGAVMADTLLCLPFFAADPVAMVREVLLDQLGRPTSVSSGVVARLVTILGAPLAPARSAAQIRAAELIAGVVAVLVVVAGAAAWRTASARVFVVQAAAAAGVLLAGPSFFLHYAAFAGHWIALTVGVGAAVLADRIRVEWIRTNALAVACVAVIAANLPLDPRIAATPQPVRPLRILLASEPGCVVSDDPGLLADVDVLSRDLADGCPLWPDVTGWTYDADKPPPGVSRAGNGRWQRHLLAYLRSADVVVVDRPATGLSASTAAEVARWPLIERVGGLDVRRRAS